MDPGRCISSNQQRKASFKSVTWTADDRVCQKNEDRATHQAITLAPQSIRQGESSFFIALLRDPSIRRSVDHGEDNA